MGKIASALPRVYRDHMISVDSVDGVRSFLDFWKLNYRLSHSGGAVNVRRAVDLSTDSRGSLVMLPGLDEPALYRLPGDIRIYTRVFRIDNVPEDLKSLGEVVDAGGRTVSHILEDPRRRVVFVPFLIDEVIENCHYERYARRRKRLPEPVLKAYYALKPFVPDRLLAVVRTRLAQVQSRGAFPSWPADTSLEDFKRLMLRLLLRVSLRERLPFIWFWPDARASCLVLTHDIERGIAGNDGIDRLLAVERRLKLRSAFNVVPFDYRVERRSLDRLRRAGCEIGVHGYSHDGDMFSDRRRFEDRIAKVNEVARQWQSRGFRSPSTYRNPDWFHLLQFDYDSSFFDTDPYEPQPGGSLSLFPYFIGDLVELPLTMPQDHTLFNVLRQKDADVWREKAELIRSRNGMVLINTHPDAGYAGDADKIRYYAETLLSFSGDDSVWNPLPCRLAEWWRRRREADIGATGLGEAEKAAGMTVRWAALRDDELVFEEM